MDRLKVDQTAIHAGKRYVLVSNINVPSRYFEAGSQNRDAIINRIDQFIRTNYTTNFSVWFEISATYQLRHRESGSTRSWVGSFNPRAGPLIHETATFDDNFINVMRRVCVLEDVIQKLVHFNNLESDWVFDELNSIIVHVSGFVPNDYFILYMRNLSHGNKRRTGRQIATFDLP
jgi:hypothetical protein